LINLIGTLGPYSFFDGGRDDVLIYASCKI